MKALSIRQPWAWAILHFRKDVENRDWRAGGTNLRDAHGLVGQEILLHAGKGMTRREYSDFVDAAVSINQQRPIPAGPVFPAAQDLPRGGIVGRARLIGIIHKAGAPDGDRALVEAFHSPWFFGPYGLVLSEAKPTHFVPMNGTIAPIFFDVPDDLVREALAA